MGEFGADHQWDAETEVGCFAPADVTVGVVRYKMARLSRGVRQRRV